MKAIIGRLLCKIGQKLTAWGFQLDPQKFQISTESSGMYWRSTDNAISYRPASGVIYVQRFEDLYSPGDTSGPNTIEYHSNNRVANRERIA